MNARTIVRTRPRRKKQSGGNAVALFVAAIVVGAAFLLAPSPGDRLIRYVPSTAVMYLHGSGSAYRTLIDLPASLHPAEFALVRFPSGTHDVTATLLSWRWYLPGPSHAEHAELARLGAVRIAHDTFAYGDADAITALTDGTGRKLDAEADLGHALAVDRSAFGIQVVLNGKLVPSSSFLQPQLPDDGRVIMGLSMRPRGFVGTIGSTARFAGFGTWGYAAPNPEIAPTMRATANEIETVTAGPNDLNILPAAFAPIRSAALAAGVPDPATAEGPTSQHLRTALAGASLHVLRGARGPVVGLTLPDTGYKALMAALTAYLNSALPARRPLTFPDGTKGTELMVGTGQVFTTAGNGTVRLSSDIRQNYGVDLFVRQENGTVIIAPDKGTLAVLTNATTPTSNPCPDVTSGPSTIVLHDARELIDFSLPIEALLQRTSASHIAFKKRGVNLVSVCGY